jgi:pyridoxamine 5'-phosphate oxidase
MGGRVRIAPAAEPFARFGELLECAGRELSAECFPEPNAMSLATVGEDGQPANRILLLKSFDQRGFVFYTNFEGRKGGELLSHPKAALCFHWPPLETQIRIEGIAQPVSPAEADAYFSSRPRASQIGAWVSLQSQPIVQEGDLDRRLSQFEQKFAGQDVPRPPHWSGFRVVPHRIEFWFGGPNRLHDRQLYVRVTDGDADVWHVQTLYP